MAIYSQLDHVRIGLVKISCHLVGWAQRTSWPKIFDMTLIFEKFRKMLKNARKIKVFLILTECAFVRCVEFWLSVAFMEIVQGLVVCKTLRCWSLHASRAVTMVDGLPRTCKFIGKFYKSEHIFWSNQQILLRIVQNPEKICSFRMRYLACPGKFFGKSCGQI